MTLTAASLWAAAQSADAQACVALQQLRLPDTPGGPAIVTSADLVEVPGGVGRADLTRSGYSDGIRWVSSIRQYCDVKGYAAPQNKFELKLPLAKDWNRKFSSVLMEAQRFPEDFDGYLPVAPVYDYTGRNTIAAAWFWRAVHDSHGGSVLNAAAANAVHRSVLRECGAQAGVYEALWPTHPRASGRRRWRRALQGPRRPIACPHAKWLLLEV
jgi:hypothetical protein